MDLEVIFKLCKQYGIHKLKTPELEVELGDTPFAMHPSSATLPVIPPAPDQPTDEQLLLWSSNYYEGPTPGGDKRKEELIKAAVELMKSPPPETNNIHPTEDEP